jgi:hypothetical protein
MKDRTKMLLGTLAWVLVITTLHLTLNVSWVSVLNEYLPKEKRKLNVAYIPVT